MNSRPFISVVIAIYNCRETLQRCLDSILGQTFKAWELIVIDGGSTDGTVDILQSHLEHLAYWVSEPDRGIYHAWNKALEHVTGEWIVFLGADDYWLGPDVLAQMVPHLGKAFPAYRVVYGQVVQVDRFGVPVRVLGVPWEKARASITNCMTLPHLATFHHHTLFAEHGRFCEDFKIAGDYEFLLREVLARPALFVDNVKMVCMQLGGVSSAPANALKMLKEEQLARRMRGLPVFNWYFLQHSMKCTLRIWLMKIFGEHMSKILLDAWRRLNKREHYWTQI